MSRFSRFFPEHKMSPCIQRLIALPYTEQKSALWLKQREQYITASEFANCFNLSEDVVNPYIREFGLEETFYPDSTKSAGKDGRQKYIQKKSGEGDIFTGNQATRFGQRYENVAIRIYQQMKQMDVFEFGLVPHRTIKHLGASPDGCSVDGTLVEIKCPSTRTPTGTPPFEYWCQMQSQMECCDAPSCDFFDASFVEYIDHESWATRAADWEKNHPNATHHVFGMYYLPNQGGEAVFAPVTVVRVREFETWFASEIKKADLFDNPTPVYYHLCEYFLTPVKRDQKWFTDRMAEVSAVWTEISCRRQQGVTGRPKTVPENKPVAPKKRLTEDLIKYTKCLI